MAASDKRGSITNQLTSTMKIRKEGSIACRFVCIRSVAKSLLFGGLLSEKQKSAQKMQKCIEVLPRIEELCNSGKRKTSQYIYGFMHKRNARMPSKIARNPEVSSRLNLPCP